MRPTFKVWSLDRLLICAMPLALLAGAWLVGDMTIDHLLRHDAVMTGQAWSTYLAENVTDLDRIAAGEKPTAESQRFFDRVRKVGQVFRYAVYDQNGRVRFASNDDADDDEDRKDGEARNPSAVLAMTRRIPVVNVEEAEGAEVAVRPPYFAETYIPVVTGGHTVGVVETYVDQTEKRDAYLQTLSFAGAALLALVGSAFGVPALAWHRRTGEKERADARIRFLAHHDPLTGVMNRERLETSVAALLDRNDERSHTLALHYVDVDHFKDVNDALGHGAGDALIRAVAERLTDLAGSGDWVARVGGDDFVVLQAGPVDEALAREFASGVVRALARPFVVEGHELAVTASLGVALAPAHGADLVRLMRSADLALYRTKDNGRNGATLFSSEMDAELAERMRMERALRHAVQNDGFELYFQPAIEMPARRLVGYEALVRMRDAEGGLIPPAAFIPLAERMGLIDEIGTWVLREACRTAASWPSHIKIAVNLSPAQLSTGRLAETVSAVLRETGLDPRRLELEVTEGMLLDDGASVMDQLGAIKASGVDIVMDDFGTGYSSLSYLWKFPFDKIKVDRAFMLGLDRQENGEAATIVRTIIDLGRSLNVTVTVEGVENDRQVDFVNDARCDQIQGFYFGRPMPSLEVAAHVLRSLDQQSLNGSNVDRTAVAA